jgi:hypothetical protein
MQDICNLQHYCSQGAYIGIGADCLVLCAIDRGDGNVFVVLEALGHLLPGRRQTLTVTTPWSEVLDKVYLAVPDLRTKELTSS